MTMKVLLLFYFIIYFRKEKKFIIFIKAQKKQFKMSY